MTVAHGCPLPDAGRKWRNSPYICECGQGWRVIRHDTYAGHWFEWVKWPGDEQR